MCIRDRLLIRRGYSYRGMVYGMVVTAIVSLLFFAAINRREFDLRLWNKAASSQLLRIAAPFAPVSLAYWAFRSADKLMITHMLGLSQVGIYSFGTKVSYISQLIYSAFAGGWHYFAFSTMRDRDQVELTSKVLEYLGAISFFATFFVCLLDDWIFELFFEGDYVKGVEVFPYLFLSPLILMLFQTASNQFLVVKKSGLSTLCIAAGLAVNLALNYFCIRYFGIRGAALATFMGYAVTLGICLWITAREGLIQLKLRFLALCTLILGFVLCQFFFSKGICAIYSVLGMLLCLAFYGKDASALVQSIGKEGKGR